MHIKLFLTKTCDCWASKTGDAYFCQDKLEELFDLTSTNNIDVHITDVRLENNSLECLVNISSGDEIIRLLPLREKYLRKIYETANFTSYFGEDIYYELNRILYRAVHQDQSIFITIYTHD